MSGVNMNVYFKNIPYVGDMTLEYVFYAYDEPILFVCTDIQGTRYLCSCCKLSEEWAVAQVTEKALLEMLDELAARVSVPIIASGGAGTMEDFARLFARPGIDGGLAASIFHTRQVDIKELKRYLRDQGVEMRI